LNQPQIIRRCTAAFFLLLFSFCITPKRFLHDLLANHRDTERITDQPVQEIFASGFHCHIDSLVVMAPFLPGIQPGEGVLPAIIRPVFAAQLSAFVFVYPAHTGVRGPPADFCS
jgi:hypothetical protein